MHLPGGLGLLFWVFLSTGSSLQLSSRLMSCSSGIAWEPNLGCAVPTWAARTGFTATFARKRLLLGFVSSGQTRLRGRDRRRLQLRIALRSKPDLKIFCVGVSRAEFNVNTLDFDQQRFEPVQVEEPEGCASRTFARASLRRVLDEDFERSSREQLSPGVSGGVCAAAHAAFPDQLRA